MRSCGVEDRLGVVEGDVFGRDVKDRSSFRCVTCVPPPAVDVDAAGLVGRQTVYTIYNKRRARAREFIDRANGFNASSPVAFTPSLPRHTMRRPRKHKTRRLFTLLYSCVPCVAFFVPPRPSPSRAMVDGEKCTVECILILLICRVLLPIF